MFAFLSIALLLALVSFGGTGSALPPGMVVFFAFGLALWVLGKVWRGGGVDVRFLILAAISALLAVFVDARLALGPMAASCAWAASRDRARLVRFLHVLLVVGVLEALLGLYQYFVAPGWILGYTNPFAVSSGTLINRNHFAGLLGMLIPVAIGLGYRAWARYRDPARTYLYLLCGSIMGLALIFSLSRMGITSFLASLAFLAVLIRRSDSRKLGSVFALVMLCLVFTGAAWIGVDTVVERYDQLVGPDGVIREARLTVFEDTVRLIAANPGGIGPGAYEDVFRRYQTTHNALLFDHAHNDYLETAAEWGIAPAFVFWAGVLFVFGVSVKSFAVAREPETKGVLLAVAGAIFYILCHSLVDFNLQIPSNAMLFWSFLGIAVAIGSSEVRSRVQLVGRGRDGGNRYYRY